MCGQVLHTLLADRRAIQIAPPRGGRSGSGQRKRNRTPFGRVRLGTRRFKGPFGSPPFVPTLTRSRPLRAREPAGTCAFASAAIAWRFLMSPPRHGENSAGSLTRTNRRARLVPLRGIRHPGSGFHNGVAPPVPFKRLNTLVPRLRDSRRLRRQEMAGRTGHASHRQRSGLKVPARPLAAPVEAHA